MFFAGTDSTTLFVPNHCFVPQVKVQETLEVHIPKGAPDGHKINFSEKVHLPQLPERMGKVTWFIAVVDPLPCISPCQT